MIDADNPVAGSAKAKTLWPCDIVMAGGVTSGIIYPGAVAKIAEDYSFHSIGGTSVGAIAAAGAAAAEYRRRKDGSFAGFEMLAGLHKELTQDGRGHTRLFHLFTPERGENHTPDTRPLLGLLTPVIAGGSLREKLAGVVRFAIAQRLIAATVLVSAAVGLLTEWWLLCGGHYFSALLILLPSLALSVGAGVLMLIWLLWRRWLPALRDNNYGICTGRTDPNFYGAKDGGYEGLTPWLHRKVQAIADLPDDKPLTFGDLWGARSPDGSDKPADGRSIELAMITSDISRNRAAQLPFLEWPSQLYIERDTLERYFPPAIACWMKKNAGKTDKNVSITGDVYRLPPPEKLPIVFAVRMSLSFPVLLSAVPLRTPFGLEADGRVSLQRVWYSDGGLTSNFPIHFFDSPIPSRPTFCLNLVGYNSKVAQERTPQPATDPAPSRQARREAAKEQAEREAGKPIAKAHARQAASADVNRVPKPAVGDSVWGNISMARRNEMAPVPFTGLDEAKEDKGLGLVTFAASLINTARHWSDNQMLCAPGTRDRVVHVALLENEGGLNLDMPAATIADLDLRGRAAGMLIAARFNPEKPDDPETGKPGDPAFPNHRWVRYRNFMAAFEKLAETFRVAREKSDAEALERLEASIDDMIAGRAIDEIGYRVPPGAASYFRTTTVELEALAERMHAAREANATSTFDPPPTEEKPRPAGAAPRPKMRAYLRPLPDNDPRA